MHADTNQRDAKDISHLLFCTNERFSSGVNSNAPPKAFWRTFFGQQCTRSAWRKVGVTFR